MTERDTCVKRFEQQRKRKMLGDLQEAVTDIIELRDARESGKISAELAATVRFRRTMRKSRKFKSGSAGYRRQMEKARNAYNAIGQATRSKGYDRVNVVFSVKI